MAADTLSCAAVRRVGQGYPRAVARGDTYECRRVAILRARPTFSPVRLQDDSTDHLIWDGGDREIDWDAMLRDSETAPRGDGGGGAEQQPGSAAGGAPAAAKGDGAPAERRRREGEGRESGGGDCSEGGFAGQQVGSAADAKEEL